MDGFRIHTRCVKTSIRCEINQMIDRILNDHILNKRILQRKWFDMSHK